MSTPLTHFDQHGQAHMVDVSAKEITHREARAECYIAMSASTLELVRSGQAGKGDVLGVARLAGIMAAKRTSDLIPLCHPLPISKTAIEFEIDEARTAIHVRSTVKTTGQTGVEMEALTAASTAALTIYDMLKAAQKDMQIENLRVTFKEGGKSGRFEAP